MMLGALGRKESSVLHRHLSFPKKQVTVIVQREVESSQDALLCLGVEIHERVPTDEQIDARKRGVVDNIVVAKQERTEQVAPKYNRPLLRLEILLPQIPRHLDHVFGLIASPPRLA